MAQWHMQQQTGRMERLVAGKHIPLCYFPLKDNGASGTPYIAVTHQSCMLQVLQLCSPPGKGTGSLQGFPCRNTLLPPKCLSSWLPAPEAAFNGRLCLAELIITDRALPYPNSHAGLNTTSLSPHHHPKQLWGTGHPSIKLGKEMFPYPLLGTACRHLWT